MKNIEVKRKLTNNELTIGTWLTISSPKIIEIISKSDFDWLCLDIEHNLFDNEKLVNLIRLIQSYGLAAFVRVSLNEPVIIKHCMDAGADGLIIPMVNTKEDALKAIDSIHYPPIGNRGVGLSRAQDYGDGFEAYKSWLKNYAVIIVQIEHKLGIENLNDIIGLEHIDGAIIGPYDLSSSLGFPGEIKKDEVVDEIIKFKEICFKSNFPCGVHLVKPDISELESTISEGYSFIAYGTDFNFLKKGLELGYSSFKKLK